MMDVLSRMVLGNTVMAYLVALAIFVMGALTVSVLRNFVLKHLKIWSLKTHAEWDDFLIGAIDKYIVPVMYFACFVLALKTLALGDMAHKILSGLSVVIGTFAGIMFISDALRFMILSVYVKRASKQPDLGNRFKVIMPALSVSIWVVGILFLLDNLGVKVSAVMAGLGIGGVAVALAGSVILSDLFAYVAIVMDQPFVIGDFIIVNDFMGTVEKIGVKTTRVRSLGGELLVFSNKDLTDSRIRNYQQMNRRRVVFKLGVTYDTPLDTLREIPVIIKDIILSEKKTTFDRAHFFTYDPSSLTYEIVYYVETADYNQYMDIQQDINFAIKERFDKREIHFAFPTQTLYVNNAPWLAGAAAANVPVQ